MRKFLLSTFLSAAVVIGVSPAIAADNVSPHGWQADVGAGAIYAPAFQGSNDYQFMAVPNIAVKYKDQFFASVQDGIGYNAIRADGWRAGPLVKYNFGRQEDGENPFRVAGNKTNALRGLGDVDGTLELGGFVEYSWREWSAKVEARQGVGGHESFVSDLSANYTTDIHKAFYTEGPPFILSVGPRVTLVGDDFNQTYYGVDAGQSVRSGLVQYKADGGLLSYGVGAAAILPITDKVSTTLIAGYDRLSGDAADSPLVQQRGSEDQVTVGLFVSYTFGN